MGWWVGVRVAVGWGEGGGGGGGEGGGGGGGTLLTWLASPHRRDARRRQRPSPTGVARGRHLGEGEVREG